MTDDKILSGDDVISRESPEYKELLTAIRRVTTAAEKLIAEARPCLLDERYFTTEQIMYQFNISRRALQNYRDKGIVPYTSIGSVILYPESKIKEMLKRNYFAIT